MKIVDKTGMRFGRWLVLEKTSEIRKGKGFLYVCVCDCGTVRKLGSGSLNERYPSRSCGCLRSENVSKATRKSYGESAFNHLYLYYKNNSKKKNRKFLLSKDDFKYLTQGHCYYCGIESKQIIKETTGYGEYIYNGIDRVDSSVGYVLGNVMPCCSVCNIAKHDMGEQEFLLWIRKVFEYRCV